MHKNVQFLQTSTVKEIFVDQSALQADSGVPNMNKIL